MRPKENDGQAPGCPSQAGFGTGAGGIAAGGYFFIVSLAKKVDGTELLVLLSKSSVLKELILVDGRPREKLRRTTCKSTVHARSKP